MANAQILEAHGSNVTSSTTAWVDVATLAAASFTANTEYLILAFATGTMASSANELRLRLVHGATPTEFTDASDAEEIVASSTRVGVGWMVRFSQGASTEDVKVQVSSASTQLATAEYAGILAIRLSDLGTENTDWRWNEVTADLTLTTTYQDGASVTFTPNGTDKYLYIGQAAWVPGSTTAQTDIHLTVDGTEVVLSSEEGEDTALEVRNRLFVWAGTPSAASHTVKLQAKGETAGGTLLSSRVIAINLAKFDQAFIATGSGPTALTEAAGWINLATVSVTPNATGNFVVLGSTELDWNAAPTASAVVRLQHNDSGSLVSHPAYGDNAPGADTWDGTDHRIFTLFDLQSLTSGASRTVNLDGEMVNTGTNDPNADNRALVVFSVALAGGTNTVSGSFTADAYIKKTQAASFTANAYIKRTGIAGTLTADAYVKRLGLSSSVTADAFIKRVGNSGTFTADAFIFRTFAASFSADANIKATVSGSLTADAYVKKTLSGSITADAFIAKTLSGSFTADAYVKVTFAGSATADAQLSRVGRIDWTTPSDGATITATPVLTFLIPQGVGPVVFELELDTVNTFDGVDYRRYRSHIDATGWEYWNGTSWVAVPTSGVAASFAGNEARFTVPTDLAAGTWYRRIRGGA